MAITYATWNPADKSSNITLSGGDLTATNGASSTWAGVRSTIGVSSGKWYWEYTITVRPGGAQNLDGIGNSSATLTTYVGATGDSWGYYTGGGQKAHSNSFLAYGATYTTGDVIGVALDMDGGTLEFFKNNTSQGVAYNSGLTGTIYAMMSNIENTCASTANFGATALTYSPPSGYNAGLYTDTGGGATYRRMALLGVGQ